MDFPCRQALYPMAKLGGIIAVLVLSLLVWPDSSPAVEAPLPAGLSIDNGRIAASAVQSAAGPLPSAQIKGAGDAVCGPMSVQSRTFPRHQRFQHILQSTPKDHGLAPEKSHEADVSMK